MIRHTSTGPIVGDRARRSAFAPWATLQKRSALRWFAAAWLGAWLGVAGEAPFAVLLIMTCVCLTTAAWRIGVSGWAKPVALAGIAFVVAAAAVERHDLYQQWERDITRGERGVLRGRIVDVEPYFDRRVALTVEVRHDVSGFVYDVLVFRPKVRMIASADELQLVLEALPPGQDGSIAWPVRVYPFLPRGNPGEFDRRTWAMRRGLVATAYLDERALGNQRGVAPAEEMRTGGAAAGGSDRIFCSARGAPAQLRSLIHSDSLLENASWRWRCRLAQARDTRVGAVAVAMVLGQKDLIDPAVRDTFSRAGIGHLLAVSGLHVGFVTLMIVLVVRGMTRISLTFFSSGGGRGGVRRKSGFGSGGLSTGGSTGGSRARELVASVIIALGVAGYVMLVNGPASALRAGSMAGLALAAKGLGRRTDTWQLLGIAGTALLFYNPLFVADLGFQMSLLAVAGILGVVGPLKAWHSRPPSSGFVSRIGRWATAGIVIAAGAQAATLPLVASAFSVVSWISPLTNLVAVPLGGVAVASLASGSLLGDLFPPAGDVVIRLGHFVVAWLLLLARSVAPWGAVEVAMPSGYMVVGWYLTVSGVLLLLRGVGRVSRPLYALRGKQLVLCGMMVCTGAALVPTAKSLAGVVEIWVLDVGQGDAVLVRAPWGKSVLVDGGGVPGAAATGGYDVGAVRVVPTLKRLGVRRLEAVVNTHPHEDHAHGLAAVVSQRQVARVYASAAPSDAPGYRHFVQAARDKGLKVEQFVMGQRVAVGRDLTLHVLAAGRLSEWDGWPTGEPSVNDRSVVLALDHEGRRFLLLGDVEMAGLTRLLGHSSLRADGLVLPHHGARGSFLPEFLEAVDPRVAVVSVGRNSFGHPSPDLLGFLAREGVRVTRTDRNGAVRIQLWSRGIRVTTVRGASPQSR